MEKDMIYLDHAATTACSREVAEDMMPYYTTIYGNPGALYELGMDARKAVNKTRRIIAKILGAEPSEIYFTSGASESNNWILRSVPEGKHIITSAIEHPSVLNTCKELQKKGYRVTYIPVDAQGFVKVKEIEEAICEETFLISLMAANNEIGTMEPIEEIGSLCKEKHVLFHTDAVQAFGHRKIDVGANGIDFLSASAHKFGGPKGTGFLYAKQGTKPEAFITGGEQERNRRAGTENVAGIVGMGSALIHSVLMQNEDLDWDNLAFANHKLENLRNELAHQILTQIEGTALNGPELCEGQNRYRQEGNLSITFEGIRGESLALLLAQKGICVSTGSACTVGSGEPSHVLLATGRTVEEAHGTIRFSLGYENTREDIDQTVKELKEAVENLRKLSR